MKKYRIVGWYSTDGTNPHVVPFARVVEVEANGPEEAYAHGEIALEALYNKEGVSADFLNWFISEIK